MKEHFVELMMKGEIKEAASIIYDESMKVLGKISIDREMYLAKCQVHLKGELLSVDDFYSEEQYPSLWEALSKACKVHDIHDQKTDSKYCCFENNIYIKDIPLAKAYSYSIFYERTINGLRTSKNRSAKRSAERSAKRH
jgi:hypothetical protein